jgi:hypothetical protein
MAAKKTGTTKRSAAKKSSTGRKGSSSPRARTKVAKVMDEFKHGQLKSGGRRTVTKRKQAVAIGLSEARRSGAAIPGPRSAAAKRKSASGGKTASKRASGIRKTAKIAKTARKSSRSK